MGKKSEQLSAARQFHADQPRTKTAREECEEGDDAEALMMEAWAECMRARGVERRVALQCAGDIWELQRARDAACAGMGGARDEGGPPVELLEMLSRIGREIAQAPKPKMTAAALLLALGDLVMARSARQLAERCRVSHELVANRVEEWQALLGLPRTSFQKSPEAIASYKGTNGAKAKFKDENN